MARYVTTGCIVCEIYSTYEQLRLGVFFDQIWDMVGDEGPSKPVKRTTQFLQLSNYICSNLPDFLGQEYTLPVATYVWNADLLYHILRILTSSEEVSEFVHQFIEMQLPKDAEEWTWGLHEEGQNDET